MWPYQYVVSTLGSLLCQPATKTLMMGVQYIFTLPDLRDTPGPRIIGVTAVQLSGQIWGQRPKTPIQMSGQIDPNLEDTRPDVRTDLIVEHIDVRYP